MTMLDAGELPMEHLASLAQCEGRRQVPIYHAHRWFTRRFSHGVDLSVQYNKGTKTAIGGDKVRIQRKPSKHRFEDRKSAPNPSMHYCEVAANFV